MATYKLRFPRWEEDIVSRRRTLLHLPSTPTDVIPRVGDRIVAVSELDGAQKGAVVEIVEVTQVRLVRSLTPLPGAGAAAALDDMARLNLMPGIEAARMADFAPAIAAYHQRWDATNPDVPWETDPMVWRIVFRYLEALEALGVAAALASAADRGTP